MYILTALALVCALGSEDPIALAPANSLDAFRPEYGAWAFADSVAPRADNPRRLQATGDAGTVLYNGPAGRTVNLVTKDSFGDVDLRAEFLVPKGANSGIKFNGQYEVQIADSYGKAEAAANDCGGIYPRAELLPTYHHIDKGFPPSTNASREPGAWQTLEISFRAPRFNAEGKKIANARFAKVVLNGTTIHENRELPYPTGHAWRRPEMARGPILLQGDHGPVAFRNITIKPALQGATTDLNAQFNDPALNVQQFVERFESESREVFHERKALADACGLKAGMTIADVGAGTGAFSLVFSERVGPTGAVHAVDISQPFLDSIARRAKEFGFAQLKPILGTQTDTRLPEKSCDVVFICDTYHHFENPQPILASIRKALRPGGKLVIVEFDKHDNASDFIKQHVRGTKAEFVNEIEAAGFRSVDLPGAPKLKENFIAAFEPIATGGERE